MAEEIHFKIGHFRNFEGPVTLTLTSDDIESHIVAHVLSTSTKITCSLVATLRLIVEDGRTNGQTDGRMDGHVFTNSISHLRLSAEMTQKRPTSVSPKNRTQLLTIMSSVITMRGYDGLSFNALL